MLITDSALLSALVSYADQFGVDGRVEFATPRRVMAAAVRQPVRRGRGRPPAPRHTPVALLNELTPVDIQESFGDGLSTVVIPWMERNTVEDSRAAFTKYCDAMTASRGGVSVFTGMGSIIAAVPSAPRSVPERQLLRRPGWVGLIPSRTRFDWCTCGGYNGDGYRICAGHHSEVTGALDSDGRMVRRPVSGPHDTMPFPVSSPQPFLRGLPYLRDPVTGEVVPPEDARLDGADDCRTWFSAFTTPRRP